MNLFSDVACSGGVAIRSAFSGVVCSVFMFEFSGGSECILCCVWFFG